MTNLSRACPTAALLVLLVPFVWGQEAGPDAEEESFSIFRSLEVPAGRVVENEIVCMFCRIDVAGTVHADVVAIWGNVAVNGWVEGDVVAVGGYVETGAGATITGDVVALGGDVVAGPGARFGDETVAIPYLHVPGQLHVLEWGALILLAACSLLGLMGALCRWEWPGASRWWIRRLLRVLLVGIVTAFGLIGGLALLPEDGGAWLDVVEVAVSLVMILMLIYGCALFGAVLGRFLLPGRGTRRQGLAGGAVVGGLLILPVLGLAALMAGCLLSAGTATLAIASRVGRRWGAKPA